MTDQIIFDIQTLPFCFHLIFYFNSYSDGSKVRKQSKLSFKGMDHEMFGMLLACMGSRSNQGLNKGRVRFLKFSHARLSQKKNY
jgi:hypothetical protein